MLSSIRSKSRVSSSPAVVWPGWIGASAVSVGLRLCPVPMGLPFWMVGGGRLTCAQGQHCITVALQFHGPHPGYAGQPALVGGHVLGDGLESGVGEDHVGGNLLLLGQPPPPLLEPLQQLLVVVG